VALDYLWYSDEDSNAVKYLTPVINTLKSTKSGSSFGALPTCGLVTEVFGDWTRNAFIYGPVFTSLVVPNIVDATSQASLLSNAISIIGAAQVTDYYAGSWTVISTFT